MEGNIQNLRLLIIKLCEENVVQDNQYVEINLYAKETILNLNKVLDKIKFDLENGNNDITDDANFCNVALDILLDLLQILLKSKCITTKIDLLLNEIVSLLHQLFIHCKCCESLYASNEEKSLIVKNIFKKSHLLLSEYLKLLTETQNSDHLFGMVIENAFDKLIGIARTVITLDIKTTAEIWKYFTKLSEQYPDSIRHSTLAEVTSFCSEEISSALKKLVFKEITDQKNIERTLKLSNFLLKVFLKLISIFGDKLIQNSSPLHQLLNEIHEYSLPHLEQYNLPNILIEGIRSHILIGGDLLINSFIANKEFANEFFNQTSNLISQKKNIFGCLTLTINITKSLLQKDENVKNLWISRENHIVNMILNNIQFCTKELMNSYDFNCEIGKITLYEYLLINIATFTISLTDISLIESEMFKRLLNDNLITAIFVSDLWIILTRFGSANCCLSQVQFLCNFINSIQQFSSQMPQISYLSHLLYKLFILLSPALKFQILNDFEVKKNLHLWTFIGLEWITKDKIIFLNEIIDFACNNVDTFMMEKNTSPISFNSMMHSYEIISTIDLSLISNEKNSCIVKGLMDLWNLIIDKDSTLTIHKSGNSWFIEYVYSLCKITSRLAEGISTENWISILESLYSLMDDSTIDLNFIILDLLECFKFVKYEDADFENFLIPLVSKIFGKILETNNVVAKLASLENFATFTQQTCNEKIITLAVSNNWTTKQLFADYLKKKVPQFKTDEKYNEEMDRKFEHKCVLYSNAKDHDLEDIVHQSKKLKSDLLEDKKLENVIDEITKSLNELRQIRSNYLLSDTQQVKIGKAKLEMLKMMEEL